MGIRRVTSSSLCPTLVIKAEKSLPNLKPSKAQQAWWLYGYNGKNGGRPSATSFGCSVDGWSQPARNDYISLDTKKTALCFADEGIKKQLEDALDAARKVASQRNPGSKVQKARDTRGAMNKLAHHNN
eukprot:1143834-Pelagomonas_calceolata.AAC.2